MAVPAVVPRVVPVVLVALLVAVLGVRSGARRRRVRVSRPGVSVWLLTFSRLRELVRELYAPTLWHTFPTPSGRERS